MKVRCNRCGKVFLGGINSTCPKCFEILKDEDDFEILEDEQVEAVEKTENEPEEETTLTKDAENQTKRILECAFWIVFALVIILSAVFTATNLNSGDDINTAIEKYANAYETVSAENFAEILPKEYIDYKTVENKGNDDFKAKLQTKIEDQVKNFSSGVGENYKVSYKTVSKIDYTKDDITAQKNMLPYKINREVKDMKSVEILLIFKGEKSLSYRKTLLLGQIEGKWYLLNADS